MRELVWVEEEDVEVVVTFSGPSVIQIMRVSRVIVVRWKGENLTSNTPRKSEIKPIRSLQIKTPFVDQPIHSILYHKTTQTHRHELISPRGHSSSRRDGERVSASKSRFISTDILRSGGKGGQGRKETHCPSGAVSLQFEVKSVQGPMVASWHAAQAPEKKDERQCRPDI
jgi:hypothetical protein